MSPSPGEVEPRMAPRPRIGLTTQILIGLGVGIVVGALIHGAGGSPQLVAWIQVPSRIFLALIKVLVAPLIFSTLVVGIAGAGGVREVGRIGVKALIYFELAT